MTTTPHIEVQRGTQRGPGSLPVWTPQSRATALLGRGGPEPGRGSAFPASVPQVRWGGRGLFWSLPSPDPCSGPRQGPPGHSLGGRGSAGPALLGCRLLMFSPR